MNVGTLRAAFEAFVDDTVDNIIFLMWLNEAQQDAALRYSPIASITISAEALTYVDLPENYLALVEVLDENGELYRDYETTEWGGIRFAKAGTYTVYYHRQVAVIEPNNDNIEPDLHPMMHSPLYLYAAAKYWDRESMGDTEESAMAVKIMRQYELAIDKVVKKLKAQRKRRYSLVVEG